MEDANRHYVIESINKLIKLTFQATKTKKKIERFISKRNLNGGKKN